MWVFQSDFLSQVNQMRFSMTKTQQSSALRNILLSSSTKVPKPDNHTKKSYNQNLMNFELNQILSSLLSDFDYQDVLCQHHQAENPQPKTQLQFVLLFYQNFPTAFSESHLKDEKTNAKNPMAFQH